MSNIAQILREDARRDIEHNQSWKLTYTALYVTAYMTLGFVICGLGPLIPFKSSISGLPETDYGTVFSLRGLGYLSGSFIVAKMTPHYRSHHLLIGGLVLLAITCFFGVLTNSLAIMTALFFFNGVGCSCVDIMCQALTIEVHQDKVDPYMQFVHFTFGIGAFLSPLLLAWHGEFAFKLYALACVICALVAWRFPSPEVLKQNMKYNQETEPDSPKAEGDLRPISPQIDWLLRTAFFTYVGIEVGYGGWISPYATMSNIASKESAALGSAVFWGCITLGRLAAVPLTLIYSAKDQLRWLIYGCLLSASINIILILSGSASVAVYLGSAFFGLAMSAIYPMLISMPSSLGLKATASNLSNFVISGAAGESIIPVLVGIVIEKFGANSLFACTMLSSLVLYFCYWRVIWLQESGEIQEKPAMIPLMERPLSAKHSMV